MSKRLFEILDEMNVLDLQNNTKSVQIHHTFLELKDMKKSTRILAEVPLNSFSKKEFLKGETTLLLLIVDAKKFEQVDEENPVEECDATKLNSNPIS